VGDELQDGPPAGFGEGAQCLVGLVVKFGAAHAQMPTGFASGSALITSKHPTGCPTAFPLFRSFSLT
jgi:hypothetical protein